MERALAMFKRFEASGGDRECETALKVIVDGMSPAMWEEAVRKSDQAAFARLLLYGVCRAEEGHGDMLEALGASIEIRNA